MDTVDQHELIVALQELASELGRTPTNHQANAHIRSYQKRRESLRLTHNELISAAGLAPARASRITNKVFEVDIERHLTEYVPKDIPPEEPFPRAAFISDIHFPFVNKRVIEKYVRYIEKEKPEYAVIVGDAWDMYSHAKFPRSHNIFTPKQEEDLARKMNEELWREVQKAAPGIKCFQTMGNHDVRPMKRTLEVQPQIEHWVERILKELFTFEGVNAIFDPRQELFLGNVAVHHGYFSKLGAQRDFMLRNVVNGHTHVAGIVYRRLYGRTIWEMNCGLAGDPQAKGLTYTMQKTTKWTPSFSAINEDGPRVILC